MHDALIKKGNIPDKFHMITHVFTGDIASLRKLEQDMMKEQIKLSVYKNSSILEITFESLLNIDEINDMTYFLIDKCKEYNCTYDSWAVSCIE